MSVKGDSDLELRESGLLVWGYQVSLGKKDLNSSPASAVSQPCDFSSLNFSFET